MDHFKLRRSTLAAYSAPALPNSALGLPLSVYLPPFYAAYVGLDLATVGLVFMAARFWDMFTDPVLGIIGDRFNTRWGRRKPWIVASVPIMMLSAYMLFFPPHGASGLYLGGWMFLLYVGYTMLSISHMSWGSELADEYHERSRIHGWREAFLIGGMFFVLGIPAFMQLSGIGENFGDGVGAMGIFVIITLPLTVLWAAIKVPDDPHHKPDPIDWAHSIQTILKNKYLRRILIGDILAGFAPSVTGTLYIFFIIYVMRLPDWSETLLLIYFFAAFMGVPLWLRLSYTFGKNKAMAYGMMWGAITLMGFFLIPKGYWPIMAVGNLLYGAAYGAGPFLLRAMMADVSEADTVATGQKRTGLFFSLLMISSKMAGALSVGITYVLLDWIGFDKTPGAENTPEAITGLAWMFIGFPVASMLLAALTMWNFPLDHIKQHNFKEILEGEFDPVPVYDGDESSPQPTARTDDDQTATKP
ncbi:MAG: MFS transporter [Alphaproteobacteria bacterium]|nr:MAG: MFS transporter [Alphaproteobacteria bacterium]